MNKTHYETRLFKNLTRIQYERANNLITEKEFEILLGLLIEKEFSDNIKQQISHILPQQKEQRGFSFMNYEWKRLHAR
jgi:hypothetical protein